jgi:hypothetical protein
MSNIKEAQNQTDAQQPNRKLGTLNAGQELSGNPKNEGALNQDSPENLDKGGGDLGPTLLAVFLAGCLSGAVILAVIVIYFIAHK